MKIINKSIEVKTRNLFDFVSLDESLHQIVSESGIKNGVLLLRSPHTTAAIICNEKDPDVHEDLIKVIEKVIPQDQSWQHRYEGNTNARAHQAVSFLSSQHWVPIENEELLLGTWQGIFLVELFESRKRRVDVTLIGE